MQSIYGPGGIQALTSYKTRIITAIQYYFEIQGGEFKRQSSIYFGNSFESQGHYLYTEQGANAALSRWPLNKYEDAFADVGPTNDQFYLSFVNSSNVWINLPGIHSVATTMQASVEVKCSMDPYTDFGFSPGF